MTIKEYMEECYNTAKDSGWHEKERAFPEFIALCHSELSEALEAYRKEPEWHDDVAEELADVLIRIFDGATEYGLALEETVTMKMEKNKTRSWRHGGKRC